MELKTGKNIWGKAKQLFLVVLFVLLFRIIYVDLYQHLQINYNFYLSDYVRLFFTDILALSVSVILNVLFIWLLGRKYMHVEKPILRNLIVLLYILSVSGITALLLNRNHLFNHAQSTFYNAHLIISYLATLLINAIFVLCCDLFLFFRNSRTAIKQEGDKKRKAQYQYQQLKQQLNPHFLFNSLNVLDYLVQNEERQRASDFIRKMAGVYRYLLETGENKLVCISEEIHFVEMYTDLLKERFPEGLFLYVNIPEMYSQCQVIPCGLQILVENAIKHNIVSADAPLHIDIYITNGMIAVKNNLQPRMNRNSTGLGLANIKKQYNDIANKGINIQKRDGFFVVELPLL